MTHTHTTLFRVFEHTSCCYIYPCLSDLLSHQHILDTAPEIFLVPPLWEKRENMFELFIFSPTAAGGATCYFWLQIVNTLIETARVTIDARSRHRLSPRPTRWVCPTRPTNIDDGVEDISWIHVLGGESLPDPFYGFLTINKPGKPPIFCHSRRIERFCLLFCVHQRLILFIMRLVSFRLVTPATV